MNEFIIYFELLGFVSIFAGWLEYRNLRKQQDRIMLAHLKEHRIKVDNLQKREIEIETAFLEFKEQHNKQKKEMESSLSAWDKEYKVNLNKFGETFNIYEESD